MRLALLALTLGLALAPPAFARERKAKPRPVPTADQPANECLVETPHWDFNWQRWYQYDTDLQHLPTVQAGDVLHMHCEYNNSMSNRCRPAFRRTMVSRLRIGATASTSCIAFPRITRASMTSRRPMSRSRRRCSSAKSFR